MKTLYKITLFFTLIFSAAGVFAQMTREKGIELYEQKKYSEAVTMLQRLSKQKDSKSDALIWNYLGLALLDSGELKKGQKALEKASKLNPQSSGIRANLGYAYILNKKIDKAQTEINTAIQLDPQNAGAYYIRGTARLLEYKFDAALEDADKIIAIDANYSSAYTLKSNAFVYMFGKKVGEGATAKEEIAYLQKSIEALEYCVKNCTNNKSLAVQNEKLEALRAFHDYFMREKLTADEANKIVLDEKRTPIKIITKPQARYTDRARQNNISGTITLSVLFGANGRVTHVILLKGLGFGLDEQAVNAALQIKFEPARKNDVPIPVVRTVSYSFTIY